MTARRKRPRTVTIMLMGVIFFGAWSAAQAVAMARQASLLMTLNITPDPRLLVVIFAAWATLFWGSAVALWCRRAFTRWLIPLLILLFALYDLLRQGLFVQAPITGQGWLLRILFYDMAILFALYSLNRHAARSYFIAEQPASLVEQREQ
jgi:hypothetical protein